MGQNNEVINIETMKYIAAIVTDSHKDNSKAIELVKEIKEAEAAVLR
ncbi:hypothetical protein [Cytobacillus sp. IB215665]|nr:hypothetical protein [Cytobacillus sp. IB215665]MDX8367882.1 hypothetical protein [Cytobacillus sp. IB215665]